MRPHIDARPGRQLSRSHLIEEDERSDALPLCRRQHAANFKSAKIPRTWHYNGLERFAGGRRPCFRFFSGLPTHRLIPFVKLTITRLSAAASSLNTSGIELVLYHRDPARLGRNRRRRKEFHHRAAEYTKFGIFLVKNSYSASSVPPR